MEPKPKPKDDTAPIGTCDLDDMGMELDRRKQVKAFILLASVVDPKSGKEALFCDMSLPDEELDDPMDRHTEMVEYALDCIAEHEQTLMREQMEARDGEEEDQTDEEP